MKLIRCSFVIWLMGCVFSAFAQSTLMPIRLTCEYMENPVVVDAVQPRLSWINSLVDESIRGQKQTAWQVRVASSLEKLLADEADLWDSGKQMSEQSTLVKYAGKGLLSAQDCWWQVRVWDADGKPSAWSKVARWGMGLLEASDWKARWIGAPWQGEEAREDLPGQPQMPAPLLRKSFFVKKKIISAKAFVTGLGYFEFYVNGQKVGNDVLVPNHTNYGVREGLPTARIPLDDKFRAYRVLYLGYDITPMLRQGENAVGAILGNGFYNPVAVWTKAYGSPRFLGQIQITYADGTQDTVVSDPTWLAHRSPILADGVYFGEVYDARLEVKGWSTPKCTLDGWEPVALRKAPEGKLTAQVSPTDKVKEFIEPQLITKMSDGTYEVDFGEEISGWVRLTEIDGNQGDTIEVKYISESPLGIQKYVLRGGGGESYAPRFTWYAFQKVKVVNYPGALTVDKITAEAVYTDIETTGRFECSNGLFNRINRIWWRSQTDNMHGGIASDCPHRERSAYTGDGQVSCITVMHNFDAAAFYTKWIRDMNDAQNVETGYVPNGAPWQPGCGGGVAWGAAMNIMPWEFYLHYGDKDMLERNYSAMKEQLRYMQTWKTPEGTMYSQAPKGREPIYWLNLGDWCAPYQLPLEELVHTYYLWRCADFTARTAKVLGYADDETAFSKLADDVRSAFHKKFYDGENATYGDFGGNVFALKMGVTDNVRPKIIESLKKEIAARDGHLNTGIFGLQLFFEVLHENGLGELAYAAMNKRDFPSFGHWLTQGATTTWEQWDGKNSRNHPMFGGSLVWFYRKLAGMNVDEEQPGYKHIVVTPMLVDSLTYASYSTRTPFGEASIAWQREGSAFSLQTVVPVGSTATVYIPCSQTSTIVESGVPTRDAQGVQVRGWKDGYACFDVSSGTYRFRVVE